MAGSGAPLEAQLVFNKLADAPFQGRLASNGAGPVTKGIFAIAKMPFVLVLLDYMPVELLIKKNYLAMIENAAKGENWMFRNFYIETDGKESDALDDGRLSCATFTSSILYLFNSVLEFLGRSKWIGFTHANTVSTEKDMLTHGWYVIKELIPGAVLVWEKKLSENDNREYSHIGFYIGGNMAVSNDSRGTGFPQKHHHIYNGTRKIEKIYWHPALND